MYHVLRSRDSSVEVRLDLGTSVVRLRTVTVKMTVTGVDMNRDGFQTCCKSLRLATALLCRMEESTIIPKICPVETVLSWMFSLSAFFLGLLDALCGHTIPSRLPCLCTVCRVVRCPRVLELRLEVGYCAHRLFHFPCFNILYFARTMCIASSSGFGGSITSTLQRKVRVP